MGLGNSINLTEASTSKNQNPKTFLVPQFPKKIQKRLVEFMKILKLWTWEYFKPHASVQIKEPMFEYLFRRLVPKGNPEKPDGSQ